MPRGPTRGDREGVRRAGCRAQPPWVRGLGRAASWVGDSISLARSDQLGSLAATPESRRRRVSEYDRFMLPPYSPVCRSPARRRGSDCERGARRTGTPAEGRVEVEWLALAAERTLGHEPRDVSAAKVGYDIESREAGTGRLRFIEVKGRAGDAETVTVTHQEIRTALNTPDAFILAIVRVEDGYRQGDPLPAPPLSCRDGFRCGERDVQSARTSRTGRNPRHDRHPFRPVEPRSRNDGHSRAQ